MQWGEARWLAAAIGEPPPQPGGQPAHLGADAPSGLTARTPARAPQRDAHVEGPGCQVPENLAAGSHEPCSLAQSVFGTSQGRGAAQALSPNSPLPAAGPSGTGLQAQDSGRPCPGHGRRARSSRNRQGRRTWTRSCSRVSPRRAADPGPPGPPSPPGLQHRAAQRPSLVQVGFSAGGNTDKSRRPRPAACAAVTGSFLTRAQSCRTRQASRGACGMRGPPAHARFALPGLRGEPWATRPPSGSPETSP